jgi:hypothetical protein
MDNTNEMFILNKYRYIRHIVNNSTCTQNFHAKNANANIKPQISDKEKEKAEEALRKAQKKKEMAELCKPKNLPVHVEKKKYENKTPVGDKKGNNVIK